MRSWGILDDHYGCWGSMATYKGVQATGSPERVFLETLTRATQVCPEMGTPLQIADLILVSRRRNKNGAKTKKNKNAIRADFEMPDLSLHGPCSKVVKQRLRGWNIAQRTCLSA